MIECINTQRIIKFYSFLLQKINSTSHSGSSSNSSRSPSPSSRRKQYSSNHNSSHKSPVRGRHAKRSSTPEAHKRRHSPGKKLLNLLHCLNSGPSLRKKN